MVSDIGLALFRKYLTYDPHKRISCKDALKDDYFKESPLAIDPSMFPTWPAKSEMSARGQHAKKAGSPRPPSGLFSCSLSFVAKRGQCTSIWQFCGLFSVPWELSSKSLAGLALDLKLVMLRVHGCQIVYNKFRQITQPSIAIRLKLANSENSCVWIFEKLPRIIRLDPESRYFGQLLVESSWAKFYTKKLG